MKTRVAINGFGRIGRNAFKVAFDRSDVNVVAINDLSDSRTLAHLLKHDSTYGTYQHSVTYDEANIIVNGVPIKVLSQADPRQLPWSDLMVDVVIEATGKFNDAKTARTHIESGAKKVLVSAPVGGGNAPVVLLGVNEDALAKADEVISNGSCAANCVSPVVAVIDHAFGVDKVMTTTIHGYVTDQRLQDGIAADLRSARDGAQNIVPMTQVPAPAGQALDRLANASDGLTIHVPTSVVALNDCVFITKKSVTVEEVNEVFRKAATEPFYQGILGVTDEPLVSSDFIGNSYSAIIDLGLTRVVGGTMIKVVAWYDNEWGYSNRLVEMAADVGRLLHQSEDHSAYHD